jgi:hypothetical protein
MATHFTPFSSGFACASNASRQRTSSRVAREEADPRPEVTPMVLPAAFAVCFAAWTVSLAESTTPASSQRTHSRADGPSSGQRLSCPGRTGTGSLQNATHGREAL